VIRGNLQLATSDPAEPITLGRIPAAFCARVGAAALGFGAIGPAAIRLFLFAALLPLVSPTRSPCGRAIAADRIATPTISLAPANSPQAAVEVRGLSPRLRERLAQIPVGDPRWPQILAVFVSLPAAASKTNRQPPMLGKYRVTREAVRFQPRFPLERGVEYRVVFSPSQMPGTAEFPRIEHAFLLPAMSLHPPARVAAIYPSSRNLPENLLRFYVKFSAPMSQGKSYERVRLRDETGSEIARPFLELPQELWSPDGTRLTLLFEPGRVKRGLVPRTEEGPILIAGRSYTLTIDANWPDAEGRPLQDSASKSFRATPAEMAQPDPRRWSIARPRPGSCDPLVVRFPKPLDHAMLEHVISVARVENRQTAAPARSELAGTVRIDDEERRWTFEPRDAWRPGRHALVVATTLEDSAGNSIRLPFEVDLNRPRADTPKGATIEIEFTIQGN
jgi:hypothetical protein